MNQRKKLQFSQNSFSSFGNPNFRLVHSGNNQSLLSNYKSIKNKILKKDYLIKIPVQDWIRQKDIYLWRLEKRQCILGVQDFRIISQGSVMNNRVLVKVSLEPYANCFSELAQLSLTKSIQYFKNILSGTKALIKQFGIKIIRSDNIVIGLDGQAKVWICKNLQLNSDSQQQSCQYQQKQVCQSIIDLMCGVCLKTKLSIKFFKLINSEKSIQSLLNTVKSFQQSLGLFTLASSKDTTSTIQSSLSYQLKFSGKSVIKKRKSAIQKIKSLPYLSSQLTGDQNLLRPQIRQSDISRDEKAQSFHFVPSQKSSKISQKCPKISSTTNITATRANSGILSPNPQACLDVGISKFKGHSFVISEVYRDESDDKVNQIQVDNESKHQIVEIQKKKNNNLCFTSQQFLKSSWQKCFDFPKVADKIKLSPSQGQSNSGSQIIKPNQGLMSSNILGSSRSLSDLRYQTLKSQFIEQIEQDQQEVVNPFQIIVNNGWSTDLLQLLQLQSVKQSFTVGKQQNGYLKNFTLAKLDRMGRQCIESFLPVEQQQYSLEF